jgi:predicted enzyme related to lactoylglutathione lyase
MPMPKHHTINYVEFPAEDLAAVKQFYGKAFGWKFTDYGPDYTSFTDGVLDGGFAKGTVAGETGALVVLYSDNLEASVETVAACGGKIAKPIFTFPGGRRFHFIDPAGNGLAVWSDK